ncbi:prepilin-type N-terminal cleavage/methylation domain-containing protein [Legionella sp. 16cNR16C]|uniref:prepilin-type N-terminal cleavage/methylation domain-containing protein n=1 Tax=Legionella sp. 16cNR16C TaxID=2905656 RepID=UPI001E46324A|nr:prepilin-type N-terminal cleavage/methylation domain-containing protein [Legionella sp. 16cNR16C]MCE3044318.1 prepilin-type N-terminal cleavage/methylation domain-containing protein [Legionella sp. 16cNR16C]
MRFQQGISLVELLVSLFLSSLLLMVLNQQYINTRQQYSHSQNLLEKENDLLMLVQLLRDSSRRAGFSPCANIASLINPGLETIHIDNRKMELRLSRMNEAFSRLLEENGKIILLEKNETIKAGQTIVIADCFHAETRLVKMTRFNHFGQLLKLDRALIYQYLDPVYAGLWIQEQFSVENHTLTSPALFYTFNKKEELSSIIDGMKTELIRKGAYCFLKTMLFLKKSKPVELLTRVRAV